MSNSSNLLLRAEEQLLSLPLEEILEWKQSLVTQYLVLYLQAGREAVIEGWTDGSYSTETTDGTAQKNAEALGKLQAIEDIQEHAETLDKIYKEIEGDTFNDYSGRT